jgi:hypothetical protein
MGGARRLAKKEKELYALTEPCHDVLAKRLR